MEVHVQKCQKCQSAHLKNILYREAGEPDRVFVQCHDCQEFVASYIISPMGYFHNGRGYNSFLRGVHRSGEFMSGRRIKDLFTKRKYGEQKAFDEVIEKLRIRDEQQETGTKTED